MSIEHRILSLGAGVQSTVLLLMSCRGELPRLDMAIFADAGWEPGPVYGHLEWLEEVSTIPIVRVTGGNIKEDALRSQVRGRAENGSRWASMPLRTKDRETGQEGMIRRQCTNEYKIAPIEKYIKREVLGLRPRQRAPKEAVVEKWLGITVDEIGRAGSSRNKWEVLQFPFLGFPVEMLDRPWNRTDCISWLGKHYPDRNIPKSACVGCPFRSDAGWADIKSRPEEWAELVEFDRAIRNCGGMRGEVYLHRSCRPLETVPLTIEDTGQSVFDFNEECTGYCGT